VSNALRLVLSRPAALQEVLDAADVELGFNYPFPIVTQEVIVRPDYALIKCVTSVNSVTSIKRVW
jgi:hypothetical protein